MKCGLFALVLVFVASTASAQTVTEVQCYTGGDAPRRTFSGPMVLSSVTELQNGGYALTGRKVEFLSRNDGRRPVCRSWYIDNESYIDSDGSYNYTYLRRERGWNVVVIEAQPSVTRMSCGAGSLLSEYDSAEAYKAFVARRFVEARAPRAGGMSSLGEYVSGRDTVSSDECLDLAL